MGDAVYVALEEALTPLFVPGAPFDVGWGEEEVVDTILDAIRPIVDGALAGAAPEVVEPAENIRTELMERFVRKPTAVGTSMTAPEWDPRFGSTKSTELVIDTMLEAIAVRIENKIRQRMADLDG